MLIMDLDGPHGPGINIHPSPSSNDNNANPTRVLLDNHDHLDDETDLV